MGNYAEFWVGSFYLGKTKGEVDPKLAHLFRDSDQTVLEGKKSDLPFRRRLWFEHVKDDERVTTFFYHSPVPVVRERLNLKGYTVATALSAVSLCLELAATFYDSWRWRFEALAGATGEHWFAVLKWIKDNEQLSENVRAELDGAAGELVACMRGVDWFGYPGPDLNVPLRLALEICRDTDEFFCDETDLLLAADIFVPEDAFSFLGNLSLEGSSPTRTIIITEGRTDASIIAESLKLLCPHLADQFTFMDFEGARGGGGAGSLANILKAFAGAGIVNKTLGIFDNDTAGEAAIRTLRGIALPPNIVALKLPDLESLRSYPTIGPSGEVAMDVNGMAASIELYLGKDVLVDENSKMTPVQWTGYDTSLRKYQGEVLLKDEIQERFHNRLQACVADPQLLQTTDWFGMRAILSAIFRSFHELDGKQILSSLNEHFSY